MAQPYTKNAIREEFIRQLNEKPLSKITVKSIVDECQINRNTFYYHYSDVYAVLEEIFEEELSKGVKEYNDTSSWEEAFLRSSNFAFENGDQPHISFHPKRTAGTLSVLYCGRCHESLCQQNQRKHRRR